jgi:hypothetical protein
LSFLWGFVKYIFIFIPTNPFPNIPLFHSLYITCQFYFPFHL